MIKYMKIEMSYDDRYGYDIRIDIEHFHYSALIGNEDVAIDYILDVIAGFR